VASSWFFILQLSQWCTVQQTSNATVCSQPTCHVFHCSFVYLINRSSVHDIRNKVTHGVGSRGSFPS